jgi:hypothetical protein
MIKHQTSENTKLQENIRGKKGGGTRILCLAETTTRCFLPKGIRAGV